MIITIEISYYPLNGDITEPINRFVEKLKVEGIKVETGIMSSVITGEFDTVMKSLSKSMKEVMDKYPSVFNIKISNSCLI
ncbi:MAG: hypothetical protein DSY76_07340 [Bacteroidetes bacterium]|nr:MAG: hypothetical protein DSY76_07340 [Bacteroidota bacterium]